MVNIFFSILLPIIIPNNIVIEIDVALKRDSNIFSLLLTVAFKSEKERWSKVRETYCYCFYERGRAKTNTITIAKEKILHHRLQG